MKRIILLVFVVIVATEGWSQVRRRPNVNPFVNSQWWLGIRGGVNLTGPVPETAFSVFSVINSSNIQEKTYKSYNKPGVQAGMEFTYFFSGFSISIQPNYRRQSFEYENNYRWVDDNDPGNSLELNYLQKHDLEYLQFPLLVKYDLGRDVVRPYVQVGAGYSTLINANKRLAIDGVDMASGAVIPFESEEVITGATDLFLKSSITFLAGAGVNYDSGNVRLTFDIVYARGLHNVTSTANRFGDNRLAGLGDALDDLRLNNIQASVGILFPLKFLSKGFEAI